MRFGFNLLAALAVALPTATVPARAERTLNVAMAMFPPAKGNPHSELIDFLGVWSALLDPLTMVTDEGKLIPWLATDWRQESLTSWIFNLRDGVQFANGRPFDAAAVAAAVNYLASPAGQIESVARSITDLAGAERIDRLAVRVITRSYRPLLPFELYLVRIPEPDAWSALGRDGFADAPVGTGPFTIESWAPDRIVMKSAPSSWRRPKIDRIRYYAVPDPISRLNGFLTGKLDIISQIDPIVVPDVEAAGGVLQRNNVPAVFAIIFNNVMDRRFDDPRVRQAMNLAVDKQAILDAFFGGRGRVASQPAARATVGYNPDLAPYPYAPERARKLLAEAGYADGFEFVFEATTQSTVYMDVYQQVAADLARVGVTMTILTVPGPVFLDHLHQAKWQGSAFPMRYYTASFDALRILEGNSCLWPKPWFCDQSAVPLIERAMKIETLDGRVEAVRQIMRHSHDSAQGLFLFETDLITAVAARVKGFRSHGMFAIYEDVELED